MNQLTTRLLDPLKNKNGRISRHISQNISTTLSEKLKVKKRKNSESVVNWFKNIPNKYLYKFLMFDIKETYPSIKEKSIMEGHKICQTLHLYE